ncbi:MAG TPA: A/G-specific adenine glycosylase [Desulfuromonadales bacterium]|nr:A/G-specific adenine glycosylase [Desulfuromonadales bacterium]
MRGLNPEELTRCFHTNGSIFPQIISAFRREIYHYHRTNPRPMPWRETDDPYRILVSEIMLQQTQVERVRLKYAEFLSAFPSVENLAAAPLSDVLQLWQGLGYNRRAVALQRCAGEIVTRWGGQFPTSIDGLQSLPGIGPYTARAVASFAFGVADPLIETNIRTVCIHFFFHGHEQVSDRQIMPLVAATLDRDNPREWYYALMDYGVMLKHKHPNPGRRSSHHVQQSRFEGSNRQQRSRLVREVLRQPGIISQELCGILSAEAGVVEQNLAALQREGFLEQRGAGYHIVENKKAG